MTGRRRLRLAGQKLVGKTRFALQLPCFIACSQQINGSGPLAEDTDENGTGDGTALTAALTNYNLPIPDTGNTLKVRVRALCGTTSEEIAFDELSVTGTTASALPVLSIRKGFP